MTNLKIGLYARVSTDEQNINTQIVAIKDFCQRNDYKIAEQYLDVGISGSTDSRPAFNKLINDVRSGRINCIVVYKLDRIGRSLQHLLNLFEEFRYRKVEFVSLTQNINTNTPEGKMFLRLLMVLAEYERELIVSRIHSGLDRARKEGKTLGRPIGAKDSKRRKLSGYWNRWADKKQKIRELVKA
ncbi:MAG: recombinase family protein [Candidatus Portnoybacteria bacterium]|nr:recombinase family protein [Candidatus Portnoybacteria bacterium]